MVPQWHQDHRPPSPAVVIPVEALQGFSVEAAGIERRQCEDGHLYSVFFLSLYTRCHFSMRYLRIRAKDQGPTAK